MFSRINNHAETISDKNDFERNKDICLDLTKEYGLHISDAARQTAQMPSQGAGITLSSPSRSGNPIPDEGFAQGNGLPDDFKLWFNRHPGLTMEEVLHR